MDQVKINSNNYLFHGGTITKEKKIISSGGRVLNFVSISDNFKDAKKNVYSNLGKLNWTSGFYRKDIGYKVVD